MFQRIAPLLNIITIVQQVRAGVARMDRPAAFAVFVLTFPGTIVSFAYMWAKDLLPTWWFVNGETPVVSDATPDAVASTLLRSLEASAISVGSLESMTLGMFLGAMIGVGITMLPTAIQFLSPSIVHPFTQVAADLSLWFDIISDMPAAWAQAGQVVEFWLFRAVLACVITFIYSIVIQSLFVMFLVACISSVLVLISGTKRMAPAPQVING